MLDLIYESTGEPKMHVLRANCEEIHIQGPEGSSDVRLTNSYPSKVSVFSPFSIIFDPFYYTFDHIFDHIHI